MKHNFSDCFKSRCWFVVFFLGWIFFGWKRVTEFLFSDRVFCACVFFSCVLSATEGVSATKHGFFFSIWVFPKIVVPQNLNVSKTACVKPTQKSATNNFKKQQCFFETFNNFWIFFFLQKEVSETTFCRKTTLTKFQEVLKNNFLQKKQFYKVSRSFKKKFRGETVEKIKCYIYIR